MPTDSAPPDSKNAPSTCRHGAGILVSAPPFPRNPFLPLSEPLFSPHAHQPGKAIT
jgi:hypothetical protein